MSLGFRKNQMMIPLNALLGITRSEVQVETGEKLESITRKIISKLVSLASLRFCQKAFKGRKIRDFVCI